MRVLRGFNDLVLYAGQGPATGMYTLSLGEGEDGMSSDWLDAGTKDDLLAMSSSGFLHAGLKVGINSPQEWEQTDGSAATLQYGKKLGPVTWRYRQWVDLPGDHPDYVPRSRQVKMSLWDNGDWEETDVDLSRYSYQKRKDAVETFGYELEHNKIQGVYQQPSGEWKTTVFEVKLKGHSFKESVQLMCECIFELKM